MQPTPKQIEKLARWLHGESKRIGEQLTDEKWQSWDTIADYRKETYRGLAKELLTNPPACLRPKVVK